MKYLMLTLVLLSCTNTQIEYKPQYFFGQKIRLLGFYKTCTGTIEQFRAPALYHIVRLQCVFTDKTLVIVGNEVWVSYSDISGLAGE